jgi:hypothetical protein
MPALTWRGGGTRVEARLSRYAVVALPFAHTRPTLRPSAAGRLVLPGRGSGATGAPVLARSIGEALGGFWGDSGGYGWVNLGKDG